jgi:hypothetical protein
MSKKEDKKNNVPIIISIIMSMLCIAYIAVKLDLSPVHFM